MLFQPMTVDAQGASFPVTATVQSYVTIPEGYELVGLLTDWTTGTLTGCVIQFWVKYDGDSTAYQLFHAEDVAHGVTLGSSDAAQAWTLGRSSSTANERIGNDSRFMGFTEIALSLNGTGSADNSTLLSVTAILRRVPS